MTLDRSFAGRVCPPTTPHPVSREEIRVFAAAVGEDHQACHSPAAARALGHPDLVAPPTFAITLSLRADEQVVRDPALGLDYGRVLHREQRFTHHRPVMAGDVLRVVTVVQDVRSLRGNGVLVTRNEIATTAGEPVCTSTTTLVVRGEQEARAAPRTAPAGKVLETHRLCRADLVGYAEASGDRNPIHLDPGTAVRQGLPDVVAHGMLTMALALRAVTRRVGPAAVLECGAVFTAPIPVPEVGVADVEVDGVESAVDAEGRTAVRMVVRAGEVRAASVTALVQRSNGVLAAL